MSSNRAKRNPRSLSEAARGIIADAYLVGSAPADPHTVLQDISRGASIVGRLLNGVAERYAAAGKGFAQMVTTAGSVLWGIVEISVPDSVLFYLSRNWFKLAACLGALVIVLGVITNTKGMPSVGVDLLVGVFLVRILSSQLHRYMNTGDLGMRRVKRVLVATVALLAILGSLYLLLAFAQSIANGLQTIADGFKWVAKHLQSH
jgi:hypothetical protein